MLLNRIDGQSNPADGRRGPTRRNSTGDSGSREGEFGSGRRFGSSMAVGATGMASPGAGAKRLVDDALDGTGATAAFGAATKAAINLLGVTREAVCRFHGVADVVIAKDVAGTDDHWGRKPSVL